MVVVIWLLYFPKSRSWADGLFVVVDTGGGAGVCAVAGIRLHDDESHAYNDADHIARPTYVIELPSKTL